MGGRLTCLSQRNNDLWENTPHMHSGKCWKPDALSMRSSHLSWAVFYCGLDWYFLDCSGFKGSLCYVVSRRDEGKIPVKKPKLCGGETLLTYVKGWLLSHRAELCSAFLREMRPAIRFSACSLSAPCERGEAVTASFPAGCTSSLHQPRLKEAVIAGWVFLTFTEQGTTSAPLSSLR